LQELVLRDNKLTVVPDISTCPELSILDLSFNEISYLKGLSKAPITLKELYVSKNNVAKMEELEHLVNLELLELGSNNIRVSNCYN
jgi:protein phosphatase 1 regulatory subunit 7